MNKRNCYYKSDLKVRAEPDGKYIEGYFAVFGQETELCKGIYEKIREGAFTKSLVENDIRCLFNHNVNIVLGRTKSRTLMLRQDTYGLWGSVSVNEGDREAMDVYARVERGDISGCSFGFYPTEETYYEDAAGTHWEMIEVDTHEVSICTFPAYPQTDIQARMSQADENHQRSMVNKKALLRKRIGELNVKTVKDQK